MSSGQTNGAVAAYNFSDTTSYLTCQADRRMVWWQHNILVTLHHTLHVKRTDEWCGGSITFW